MQRLTSYKWTIFLVCLILALILGAWIVLARRDHGAIPTRLGQAVTITRHNNRLNLTPTWGGSSWTQSHFYHTWKRHQARCGSRRSPELRTSSGSFLMYFQHCLLTEGKVRLHAWPPARPRATTTPTTVFPAAPPTAPPFVYPPVYTPVPVPSATTPASNPPSDPVLYYLYLMNRTRAQGSVAALTLNAVQSAGSGSCVGSQGHAAHMAAVGQISHDQFPADLCVGYSTAGENVGESGGTPLSALNTIHGLMMSEPYTPGCSGNHVCNILSSAYHQVGIGIVTTNGATWLAVDFLS